jgi:uncharacterized protein with PQ loop repeat
MSAIGVLGWVLAAATVAPELVQLRRGSRVRSHEGISPLTVATTMVVFAWWLSYSFKLSVWPAVVTDLTALLLAVMHARVVRVLSNAWLLAIGAVAVLGAALPVWVLGAVATVGSATRGMPQLRKAWRSQELSGVSAGYWALQAASSTGWLVYGLAVGAPWLGAFALAAAPVSSAICVRVLLSQRRAVVNPLCTV